MKNDLDPFEYGSSRPPSPAARGIGHDPRRQHQELDQHSAADAFLPSNLLRQMRMELQQRRLHGKSLWRRKLERILKWFA